MINRATELPPDLRRRLIAAIRSNQIREPLSSMSLLRVLGDAGVADRAFEWLSDLLANGVNIAGAAYALECIEECERMMADPALVWTGPEVPGVHSRDTRRVFEELFRTAKESLWISTYAIFDGASMFDIIARRLDAEPDLRITILLNLMKAHRAVGDEAIRKFADMFWRKEWPGKDRPRVFYDQRALQQGPERAVLHAKGVVADGSSVFVTSANLTEAAFDRNIELGVLLKNQQLGRSVVRHFERLIESKMLLRLPD